MSENSSQYQPTATTDLSLLQSIPSGQLWPLKPPKVFVFLKTSWKQFNEINLTCQRESAEFISQVHLGKSRKKKKNGMRNSARLLIGARADAKLCPELFLLTILQ